MKRAAQATPAGTQPDSDSPARMGADPLDELEFHWRSVYHIAIADGIYPARRRDGKGSTLAGPLPEGLRLRILADYQPTPYHETPPGRPASTRPDVPHPIPNPARTGPRCQPPPYAQLRR